METTRRIAVKALSWQAAGLASMSVLGYLLTGSWEIAGSFALSASALGLVSYMVHEKIWSGVAWGRRSR